MSWKTTLCGVLGIVAAAITLLAIPVLDSDPATVANWGAFTATVATATGLLFSRDDDKSSEDVGVK